MKNNFKKIAHPKKLIKSIMSVFYIFFVFFSSYGQVGINTTNPNALLDIRSSNELTPANNDGILIPKIDNFPSVSPTNNQDGMLVFATGNGTPTKGFYYWNNTNTSWVPLISTGGPGGNTLDQAYDQGGAGLGKNINATDGAVRINGEDGFLVTGTLGTGNTIDTELTGAGTRMFFNPNKGAFRAGNINGNQWNNANIGNYSVALGASTIASGTGASAFGLFTQATNSGAVSFGQNSIASGSYSSAFNLQTEASGNHASAFGLQTIASGGSSMAFGEFTVASNFASTAFGLYTLASGEESTAFGVGSIASGIFSTAFGFYATASEETATAFGHYTTASNFVSTAFGYFSNASGVASTAFGSGSEASGDFSLAFGSGSVALGSTATAFGRQTIASSDFATSFGDRALASGYTATAFGQLTEASGLFSTAFGVNTIASGAMSTAFGQLTEASGNNAIAFGEASEASGANATAFGYNTLASNGLATAIGSNTIASGFASTASGYYTTAPSSYETTVGMYNTTYTPIVSGLGYSLQDRIFVVGNGTDNANRSNALTIYKNGTVNINDAYNLPLTDGTANQVLTTNGAGVVSFQNVTNTVYSLNQSYSLGGTGAGRIINAIYGPVEIQNNGGLIVSSFNQPNMLFVDGTNDSVGIATAIPTATLSVNGTANKPGGGTWAVFSDRKLKDQVSNYDEGLDFILQVNPVNFSYNKKMESLLGQNNRLSEKVFQGVIAQELQEIAPDMVKEVVLGSETFLEVDPNKFTYALINAVQQQQEIINQQNERLNQLENELNTIKTKIEK
ncbi:MAG: tail fiber domain-containing protein [Flavobacteriaceae bacterium]